MQLPEETCYAFQAEHCSCRNVTTHKLRNVELASGLSVGEPDTIAVALPNPWPLAIKRMIDVIGSIVGLALLAPLLLATAIVIKAADGGPVLFRQWRVGKDGARFRILKFRTLAADSCDSAGLVLVSSADDPRLTPLGAILRRYNIDELPQLLNILAGEMSLVGPRPHVPDMLVSGLFYEAAVPGYALRLNMRPGLTGWAQCNGYRGPVHDLGTAAQRVRHDLAYIGNFSLALDLQILALTLVREFIWRQQPTVRSGPYRVDELPAAMP